uniref:Uncharacterized protein n=1 Tax=Opuntia streptacantha TaxID=393608 RepID=A0A7C9DJY8_OPUST
MESILLCDHQNREIGRRRKRWKTSLFHAVGFAALDPACMMKVSTFWALLLLVFLFLSLERRTEGIPCGYVGTCTHEFCGKICAESVNTPTFTCISSTNCCCFDDHQAFPLKSLHPTLFSNQGN